MQSALTRERLFMWRKMRTLEWNYQENYLEMIDQRLLPGEFKLVSLKTFTEVAEAITNMVVRGAPAIGASAAFGIALAAKTAFQGNYR